MEKCNVKNEGFSVGSNICACHLNKLLASGELCYHYVCVIYGIIYLYVFVEHGQTQCEK